MRFEDNPERIPVVLFSIMFPTVLQNLADVYPEFVPIYEDFNENLKAEDSFPSAFVSVLDVITDSEWAANSPINTDTMKKSRL